MKKQLTSTLLGFVIAGICLMAGGFGNHARAATFTWDGGGTDGNFSTAANWNPNTAPTTLGDQIIAFGPLVPSGQTTAFADVGTPPNPRRFIFNTGAAAMTIENGGIGQLQFAASEDLCIQNNSTASQTFNINVRQYWFDGDDNRTWDASAGDLTFGNVLLLGTNSPNKNHTLTVTGAADTTINGPITQTAFDAGFGASLIKDDSGTLTLNNNSTFEGGYAPIAGLDFGVRTKDGELTFAAGTHTVGGDLGSFSGDTGTINVTGNSTITVAGNLIVGWNSSPTFNVTNGTLTANSGVYHKDAGTGNLTIGGTGVVETSKVYISTQTAGVRGFDVDLDTGGTLVTDRVYISDVAGSTSTLNINFDGGTLKARSTTGTDLIESYSGASGTSTINAIVKAGGAIIDTNGLNVSVQQPLVHDSALGATPDGGLTKTGNGTLTLTGANTYTGPTTVTAGTLSVTGSLTSDVIDVQGGTFDGSGATLPSSYASLSGAGIIDLGGATVVLASGGTLAPGNSPGTLTIADGLNVSGITDTGGLVFELGTSSDLVVVGGTLDVGTLNFADFSFTDAGGLTDGDYTLFDTNSVISGSIGTASGAFEGFSGTLSFVNGAQDIILTLTAIPEPSTAILTGLALVGFCFRRRRK